MANQKNHILKYRASTPSRNTVAQSRRIIQHGTYNEQIIHQYTAYPLRYTTSPYTTSNMIA